MKLFPANQTGRCVIGLFILALIFLGPARPCSGDGICPGKDPSDFTYNLAYSFTPSSYAVALGSPIPVVIHAQGISTDDVVWPWYGNEAYYTPAIGLETTSGASNQITSSQVASPWSWGTAGDLEVPCGSSSENAQTNIATINGGATGWDLSGQFYIYSGGVVDGSLAQTATVTLLNTNSIVSVTIPGYGNNYNSSNLLARGINGSSNCILRFSRNAACSARTINYNVTGGASITNYGAKTNGVNTTLSGTVTIPDGKTNVDISISATNLWQSTSNTITITLTNGYYKINSAAKTVSIGLMPDYPTVDVVASSSGMIRGDTTSSLVFYRETYYSNSGISRTVNYTLGGTCANDGSDFTPILSGSGVIPAGGFAFTNVLTPTVQSYSNATKTLIVTLTSSNGYNTGGTNSATILDEDDFPNVEVGSTSLTMTRGKRQIP